MRSAGLPALRAARNRGFDLNDQCLAALLRLLGYVNDTNMTARGGKDRAEASRAEARGKADAWEDPLALHACMAALNENYIAQNLSPGGCADLLAATLLADRWIQGA